MYSNFENALRALIFTIFIISVKDIFIGVVIASVIVFSIDLIAFILDFIINKTIYLTSKRCHKCCRLKYFGTNLHPLVIKLSNVSPDIWPGYCNTDTCSLEHIDIDQPLYNLSSRMILTFTMIILFYFLSMYIFA